MAHQVVEIGGGWRGTDRTVDHIYRLVDESLTDPLVVRTARAIVRNVPERDQAAESRAISTYVRSRIRYTKESVETLAAPADQIRDIDRHGRTTGDCDEFTTLSMALHKAIGIPVRAVVISQRKDRAGSHIFGQALIKGQWVTMDDIVKGKPYGWAAPAAHRTKTKTYGVSGLEGFSDSRDEEGDGMSEIGWATFRKGGLVASRAPAGAPGIPPSMMVGRTKMVRSDMLTPPRRRMVGPNFASRGYKLKPSGMIYVDRGGKLSGVGVEPQMGFLGPLISTVTSIASAGADVYGKLKESKEKIKAAKDAAKAASAAAKPAATQTQDPGQQQVQQSGGGMMGGSTPLLLLGLAALFMFGKKR